MGLCNITMVWICLYSSNKVFSYLSSYSSFSVHSYLFTYWLAVSLFLCPLISIYPTFYFMSIYPSLSLIHIYIYIYIHLCISVNLSLFICLHILRSISVSLIFVDINVSAPWRSLFQLITSPTPPKPLRTLQRKKILVQSLP